MTKPRIAIACQGGGVQTAFTAGALKYLFDSGTHREVDIVSLSGTSGGAICATLVWEAMRKGEDPPIGNLMRFWTANTAQNQHEQAFNDTIIEHIRQTNRGLWPKWVMAPSSPFAQSLLSMATIGLRKDYHDFQTLLENHIDFEAFERWGANDQSPVLVLGAANCIRGRFRKFTSFRHTIRVEYLQASAAVPSIFPAVEIDGEAYWDGLFSDNPPTMELTQKEFVGDNLPDEIWVIKINPTGRADIPDTPEDIVDRKNEMIGNESLFHNIEHLETINEFLLQQAFKPEYLQGKYHIKRPIKIPKVDPDAPDKPYHIPMIEMSKDLQEKLDYASKLDRSRSNIKELISDGVKQ